MGVDLETYRGRIGTYRHSCGQDVITVTCVINFSNGLKTIGAVLFIGVLLLIAGIESNPGPGGILSSYFFIAIVCVIIGLLLQIIEWKINALYLVCLLFVGGSFCYWTEQTTHKEKKDIASNNSDNECITQVQSSADSGLNQSTPSVVKHSTEQHEGMTFQLSFLVEEP
ncbi:uncharacterized protein LOC128551932 [Mercenaria mercenaria]|uniref:uncharacterized protein LOC128551932 n=1 Tax=Mercenaria mercenaria TaxID=6596 RepID=UPI00234E56AD|nr:uncharacterized protein LOC128551932 [Mercenaria mercenaria]